MSFRGTLQIGIGGRENYNILKFSFSLFQQVDGAGRPTSIPKGGVLHFTLESSSDIKVIEWMLSPTMTKSGSMIFSKRESEGGSMRSMYFNDAYCVNYHEEFDAVNTQPMYFEITLSARLINFGGSLQLENQWPGEYDAFQKDGRGPEPDDDRAVASPSATY